MRTIIETPLSPPWSTALALLLPVLYAAYSILSRPPLPSKAPPVFESLPVVGALRFSSNRNAFLRDIARRSPSGLASFYFGKLRVVALSGEEGRKTFFESRELDFNAGYPSSCLLKKESRC